MLGPQCVDRFQILTCVKLHLREFGFVVSVDPLPLSLRVNDVPPADSAVLTPGHQTVLPFFIRFLLLDLPTLLYHVEDSARLAREVLFIL